MLRRAPPVARSRSLRVTRAHLRAQALANGIVYNAVDGCKRLGINGGHSPRSTHSYPHTLPHSPCAACHPHLAIVPTHTMPTCMPTATKVETYRYTTLTPPLHHRHTTVGKPYTSLTRPFHAVALQATRWTRRGPPPRRAATWSSSAVASTPARSPRHPRCGPRAAVTPYGCTTVRREPPRFSRRMHRHFRPPRAVTGGVQTEDAPHVGRHVRLHVGRERDGCGSLAGGRQDALEVDGMMLMMLMARCSRG